MKVPIYLSAGVKSMPNEMQIGGKIIYFHGYALMRKQGWSGIIAYRCCCALTVDCCWLFPSGLESLQLSRTSTGTSTGSPRRLKSARWEDKHHRFTTGHLKQTLNSWFMEDKQIRNAHTPSPEWKFHSGGLEDLKSLLRFPPLCCRSRAPQQPTPLMHFHEGAGAPRQTPARSVAAATEPISSQDERAKPKLGSKPKISQQESAPPHWKGIADSLI